MRIIFIVVINKSTNTYKNYLIDVFLISVVIIKDNRLLIKLKLKGLEQRTKGYAKSTIVVVNKKNSL